MTVKITPNDKGNPPGKLADAELHFTDGSLSGLRLIGFGVWERRGGGTGRSPIAWGRAGARRRGTRGLGLAGAHGAWSGCGSSLWAHRHMAFRLA